ncbi:tRNA (guanosine(18)-2'-O)-methyltransferase TrmH [Pleionea litopenaei]|uniref:tRNA (guanosine(18)-2'-O)-methyltransferase n=1 Tax=Pleionea litopenaei TaxID=3070815 RepID=A0AA51X6S4_9GAMM|nr:tRNA (guanosine(18)-2'-O)-methyltransferase TrmH [Pleionea sp. HL-JVS1]WMS86380.1 tRNA (guanosine(18)-2'-O)-methyltransferase TrmH [Pleionea sp. HL-JVS1]
MKENRLARITQLLNDRQPDLTVLMDQVHKPHNLAAVVRTADAVGIGEVHAVKAEGRLNRCSGTAMGSDRWVKTHRYNTFSDAIDAVKGQSMQVLAAHFSDRAVDFRSIDYTKPTCILLGAEKYGVTDEAAAAADEHILIPMLGMVQSLNVSVANAIILYEAQRQRELADMYGKRRIPDDDYKRLCFEWLHPQVMRFCQKHKIRYPEINEFGDIDDPEWQALRKSV